MPKFKRGDDIVCIDNEIAIDRLTVKKVYKVLNTGGVSGRVLVEDDQGKRRFYQSERFITVDQHREKVVEENMKSMAELYLYGQGIFQTPPIPIPKKKPVPVSIVLTRDVVAKALTKMIKEDFGIDAEVTGVQPRPNRDLELLLK